MSISQVVDRVYIRGFIKGYLLGFKDLYETQNKNTVVDTKDCLVEGLCKIITKRLQNQNFNLEQIQIVISELLEDCDGMG